jgi:hypothetical protein
MHEFDTVVCQGLSGIVPASVFCYNHNKTLMVLRKDGEKAHGGTFAGAWHKARPRARYIILDDFVNTGSTLFRLCRAFGEPRCIILYNAARSNMGYWTRLWDAERKSIIPLHLMFPLRCNRHQVHAVNNQFVFLPPMRPRCQP